MGFKIMASNIWCIREVAEVTLYFTELKIPHKIVTMEEAMRVHKSGSRVGIARGYGKNFQLLLIGESIFTGTLDDLLGSTWIVLK